MASLRRKVALVLAAAAVASFAVPALGALISAHEWRMIREIAASDGLNDEQTWLLAAIRRHENGRPGLEFGVGGPMNSGHRAHRYQDGVKSFYIQGLWASGTIRKHYTGDLVEFGRRYNPPDPVRWANGVRSLIRRLKTENNNRLPGKRPRARKIAFP